MVCDVVLAAMISLFGPHSADPWRVELLEFAGASAEKLPLDRSETLARGILPPAVVLFSLASAIYGILLKPLGFLPTSALFLILAIKFLARRGWVWTLAVSLGSLIVIWLIFRIVFSVLMPAGILPEAEFIQFFRDLFRAEGAQ